MYQKLIIVGNLGKEPEMRYTPSGHPVTSFSVATTREYTKDNEKVKETTWFRVQVWGKAAEACNQYLGKGSKVVVEGRLQTDDNGGPRIWTAQDGTPRASFEVTAETVRFLGGGEKKQEPAGSDVGDGDF